MKNILLLCISLMLALLVNAQDQRKAIFIIADGIPADVIERVPTPALHAIAREGALLKAYVGGEKGGYSETPTISAVGYNSLLTATWVNKHNVWDNDIAAPNYHYPTIFRLFKQQYPGKKTAIFSTWLDNRTKLVGDQLPETGNIKVDYHFDGLELDTLQYPHDKNSAYTHLIDEAVATKAATVIRQDAPDLSWVYLEYTDDMGHRYGDSKDMYRAVQMMDSQVQRIWEAIQYRKQQFKEEWVIYITTDHGRDAKTGKGHGGQSDRERNTWIVTNAKTAPWFQTHTAGIVNIAPSIADFLHIVIPRAQQMEMDGIPLTGIATADDLQVTKDNNQLVVKWKAITKKGKAKVWLALTNNFKTGGNDHYQLVAETDLSKEHCMIDVSKLAPTAFYKVVLETPGNFLNRWVIKQ